MAIRLKASVLMFATMAVMAPVWGQTPEEIDKITQAMPDKAVAKPKKERKVLVFSQTLKYRHSSIPYGERAFQIMGEKTGAFTADITSDPNDLSAENLSQYDAIIFNNPTGETVTTGALREGLLNFVREGKGFVGIHAATDTNFDWAEYGEMLGGYFDNHPWRASDTVTLKIERPKHPLNRAFKEKTFEINDEIYQMKDPFSREKVLVLVSLDTEKTDMNKDGIRRTDNDFPISWVRDYGKGRVFYCSLGHNHHVFWDETVLTHYLDGIQFAMGDLNAPAKPRPNKDTGDNVAGGAVSEQALNTALAELEQFDFGKEREFLLVIDQAIRSTADKEAQRRQLANALTERAMNAELTFAARDLALRRLAEIGIGRNIDDLEKLLSDSDERLAEVARQTIASIPGERADKALLKALETANGKIREGVIHSLGERRTTDAIKPLVNIARMGDDSAATAAMQALGNIGNGEAARALLDDIRPSDQQQEAWLMALNDAATEISENNKNLAGRLFDRVLDLAGDSPARLAAFKGKALLEGNPEAMALKALDENQPGVSQIARELLVRGNDPSITSQLLQRLESASPEHKVTVVEILGARGEKTALPAVTELAVEVDGDNENLQVAALTALETLGDQGSVASLVKVAAEAKGRASAAAKQTLKEIPVPEVDQELLQVIREGENEDQKVVAIESATARKSEGAVPVMIEVAGQEDAKVAVAALKSIAELGTYRELAPALKILSESSESRVLREGSRTVSAMAKHFKNPQDAVNQVQATYSATDNAEVKASLLSVFSTMGGEPSLKVLQDAVESDDEKIKDAAVRALADFPTNDAMDSLMSLASESENQVHRVLSLRAVARLISQPSDKTTTERLEVAKRALELAEAAEEKKTIIGAVADLKEPGVLELIVPYIDQEELKQEAASAILKQAPVANAFNPGNTAQLLSPMNNKLENDQWVKLEETLTPGEADGGSIRAFQASQPYQEAGLTDLSAVLEKQFAPETGDAEWPKTVWAAEDDGENKGKANLAVTYPGLANGAVYLRAHVWSPDDRRVQIQTSSDDGARVWLNEAMLVETPGKRGFTWWSDKTPADLKRGWNVLLIKVAQGNGDHSVAARVVSESGEPMTDLKYSALPQDE